MVSLPIGWPGSRFAVTWTFGSACAGERVMLGIGCCWCKVAVAAVAAVRAVSHVDMISEPGLAVWFVLTLYVAKPSRSRRRSALVAFLGAGAAGDVSRGWLLSHSFQSTKLEKLWLLIWEVVMTSSVSSGWGSGVGESGSVGAPCSR